MTTEKVKEVRPKPRKGKPAPRFKAKPKPAAAGGTVACPSCRARVRLDADGNPISHDVAHFEKESIPENPGKNSAAPKHEEEHEEKRESFFSRLDRNLNQMLED